MAINLALNFLSISLDFAFQTELPPIEYAICVVCIVTVIALFDTIKRW